MNPSYGNGMPSVPGGRPGVISSGPESGAVPPVAPASPVSMPSAGNSRSGGAKRGIIIGGILIVVALILGIAAVVVMRNSRNGNGGSNTATENTEFYKYANYLLYGNQNANADLGEYDKRAEYAVVAKFNDGDTNYFNSLQNLWKEFYDKIVGDENIAETSTLRGEADFQNELMDFVIKYSETKDLTESDLLELYLNNGSNGAALKINENYEKLLSTIYALGQEYAGSLVSSDKKVIELYSGYDAYGCIVGGNVDDNCVKNNEMSLRQLATEYSTEKALVDDSILNDAIMVLTKNCFAIRDGIGGENE